MSDLDREGLKAAAGAMLDFDLDNPMRSLSFQEYAEVAVRAYLSVSRSPRDLEKEARGSDMPPAAVDAATKALNEWEDDSFDPDGVAAAIAAALPHLMSGPVLQEGETDG